MVCLGGFWKDIKKKIVRRNIDIKENDLCPYTHDLKELNARVFLAMGKVGKTRIELAAFFGMDASIPLAMQPKEKIPRPTMETVVKVSTFLGVSVRWLLHGEPENDVDFFVIRNDAEKCCSDPSIKSAEKGAAIITGANNSTVIVHTTNGGDPLSEMERAMISAFRLLKPREKTSALSYIFSLEQETIDKEKKAPGA